MFFYNFYEKPTLYASVFLHRVLFLGSLVRFLTFYRQRPRTGKACRIKYLLEKK